MKSQKNNFMARGYISSRNLDGNWIPQSIQNLTIRDYCSKNKFNFLLSSAEYSIQNCFSMLASTIKEKKVNIIVMYSIDQLPLDNITRIKLIKDALKQKKEIHFALEKKKIITKLDIEKIDTVINLKKLIQKSLKADDVIKYIK